MSAEVTGYPHAVCIIEKFPRWRAWEMQGGENLGSLRQGLRQDCLILRDVDRLRTPGALGARRVELHWHVIHATKIWNAV